MSDRAALWLGTSALVLASNSRARRRLLEDAGVPVVTALPIVDERIGEAGWDKSGGGVSARLALMKALSVAPDHPAAEGPLERRSARARAPAARRSDAVLD